jgi:hypothetical protein
MAGVDLPVMPMSHHYLVTDDVPMLAAMDREFVSITVLALRGGHQALGERRLHFHARRQPAGGPRARQEELQNGYRSIGTSCARRHSSRKS